MLERGGIEPKIVSNGNKLFQVKHPKTKDTCALWLRHSMLMFPMALSSIPASFGIPLLAKLFFPYGFNKRQNYNKTLKGLPPKKYYFPNAMKPANRAKFLQWYKKHKNKIQFDLKKALKEYCVSDVEILMEGIAKFRELFNDIAECDMFNKCCTITSGCLRIFKKRFMKENKLAVVPNHGYGKFDRQSTIALKYLKWFADAHGVAVQHRDTAFGEKRVGTHKLDGYIPAELRHKDGFKKCNVAGCPYCVEAPTEDVAIEFLGCVVHGCPFCYKTNTKLFTGWSEELLQRTQDRAVKLERYHRLRVIMVWECQVEKELSKNEAMREFFENTFDTGPLDPRDGFFGGRTGPVRMYYKPEPDEILKYYDIVSLYPYVLRKAYPVGHPTVIRDFYRLNETWESKEEPEYAKYKGIWKVRVLPPKDLFLPVLPLRDDGRLLFPLCRTCAVRSRKKSPYREPECGHTDEERSFVATTTHVELDLALDHGYKILEPIEVWHYTEWDDTIFEGYMSEFLRLKIESSGWDETILNAPDVEKAKDEFIEEYRLKENIHIRKDKVCKNPGLRYIAKLCANSLWGRFAMRLDRTQTEIVSSPSRIYELLDNGSLEVTGIVPLSNYKMRVSYKYKKRCAREDSNSNLVIAIFTTSYGRAELYKHMQAVEEKADGPKGSKLVYTDTDSVLFCCKRDEPPPIPAGRFLGEMTDECPRQDIQEFICGGNKNYGLKMRDLETGTSSTTQKVRGITFNHETSDVLSYEVMKRLVLAQPDCKSITLTYDRIGRDAKFNVFTRRMHKIYRPVFRKGTIDKQLHIYPYGYSKEAYVSNR